VWRKIKFFAAYIRQIFVLLIYFVNFTIAGKFSQELCCHGTVVEQQSVALELIRHFLSLICGLTDK
jgi:hypothetical protein